MKLTSLLLGVALAVAPCLTAAEDPFYQEPKEREAEFGFHAASSPNGIFYPGEPARISLIVPAEPKKSIAGGVLEVVSVHTRLQTPGEMGFHNDYGKPRLDGKPPIRVPLDLTQAKAGSLEVVVPLPETFGAYALTLVRADGSRTRLGNLLRVLKPTPRKAEMPQLMSSMGDPAMQERLGVGLVRTELHWGQDGKADHEIHDYAKHGIKVMVTTGIHPEWKIPFRLGGVCTPKDDPEFGKWIGDFVTKHYTGGKTGLWGLENFNEPWEPNGISGWGNDSLRYRQIQKTIYQSAKAANPSIYILASSSIMNTEDKFLSEGDGSEMMQYVDILTDHYVQPKGAYAGRMAIKWKKLTGETETWGGASEVLLHQFMAQFLAVGNSFLSPVQYGHFAGSAWSTKVTRGDHSWDQHFANANTVGVAMATWNALVQDRPFAGMAFKDHLPFVFQFGKDDDATLVLIGRLMGLQTERARDVVWPQHAFAPDGTLTITDTKRSIEVRDCAGNPFPRNADGGYTLTLSPTPWFVRSSDARIAKEAIRTGKMTGLRQVEILPGTLPFVPSADKPAPLSVRLHNLRNVPITGTLTVSTLTQQTPFSAKVPVQIATGATIAVQVPIAVRYDGGLPLRFSVDLGGVVETWDEVVPCTGVVRTPITGLQDPAWARVPTVVTMRAEGSAAGNEIDKIWKPFLFTGSEPAKLPAKRADLQVAWDDAGLSIRGSLEAKGLLRRPRLETRDDEAFFYSAKDDAVLLAMEPWQGFFQTYTNPGKERAKWDGGTPNHEKQQGEAFEKASADPAWPAFVDYLEKNPLAKHFVIARVAERFFAVRKSNPAASLADASSVYRHGRDFLNDLPFNGDSFQVAIDLDKAEERFQRLHDLPQLAWALPDGFMAVPDTDYEYSAYLCDDGKPELWCLLAPGVPRYHYYPRHARGPKGQYPVKDGAVEVQRVADRNVYFLRLTWAQLGFAAPPKAGQDFALTCKWNADGGVAFGGDYAATKSNGLTMHPYWSDPSSNTVRWTLLP